MRRHPGGVHSIRVGKRTGIQDGSIVHAIGMGAILLNGSLVGAGSIVAAGTLLVEGQQVPPRSLVMGSPGKVRRLLTQAEVAHIQISADRHVGYRLEYMGA